MSLPLLEAEEKGEWNVLECLANNRETDLGLSCLVGPAGSVLIPAVCGSAGCLAPLNLHTVSTARRCGMGEGPLQGVRGERALCPHDGWACTALVLAAHPPKT